jgi:hypothetical protein
MSSLELKIAADPWSLSFGILEQAAPTGFLCERRWHGGAARADQADPPTADWQVITRVRTAERGADRYAAILDTDHPDGRTAQADIRTGAEGAIAVVITVSGATVVSQSFVAAHGERFLGFGERSHAVSTDLAVIENYVGEGPYQQHEYPFLDGIVPPGRSGTGPTPPTSRSRGCCRPAATACPSTRMT